MSDAFEQLVIEELRTLKEGHKEIKGELVSLGLKTEQAVNIATQTFTEAKKTNGRVTELEAFKDTHTDAHLRDLSEIREAESFAAGREAERARAKHLLTKVWGVIRAPVLTGLFAGTTAAAAWLVVQLSEWSPW